MSPPAAAYRYVVISLPRSHERRANMEDQLARAGIADNAEFFDAVDGRELRGQKNVLRQARGLRYVSPRSLTFTDVACFLSHRALWRRLAEDEKHDFYVVLEDNAEFTPDLDSIVRDLAEKRDGELVWLYINRTKESRGATVRSLPAGHQLVAEYGPCPDATLFRRGGLATTHILRGWMMGVKGYLISREGARRLLDRYPRVARRVHWQLARFWEYDLPPLQVYRNAVSAHPAIPSLVGASYKGGEYMLPPFASWDPRRLASRLVFGVLRRRDLWRYARAVRRLKERYGAPTLTLPVMEGEGADSIYGLPLEPWQLSHSRVRPP